MRLRSKFSWFLKKSYLKKIKLLIMDVDGVLTNGQLVYDSKGGIQKVFNVKDGLGIRLLQQNNIKLAFLSGGSKGATNSRALDLNVDACLTGIKDKSKAILDLQQEFNLGKIDTAFIGDDLNDLVVLPYVNLLIATKDAEKSLKAQAQLILNKKGGEGAIRELSEQILRSKNKWNKYCESGWKDLN